MLAHKAVYVDNISLNIYIPGCLASRQRKEEHSAADEGNQPPDRVHRSKESNTIHFFHSADCLNDRNPWREQLCPIK